MKIVVVDIETESLTPELIWCIVTKDIEDKEFKVWTEFDSFKEYAATVDLWVAHNGISFDIPVLNRLLGLNIDYKRVIDTFVVSRTVNYRTYQTHSLEELGIAVGERKSFFNDFSRLTQEMIDYCIQDVRGTEKVYQKYSKYIWDKNWSKALRVEHDIALVCNDMQNNGFSFNRGKAKELLDSILERMTELEAGFQVAFPPQLVEVNRLQYRVKANGELFKTTADALSLYPKTEIQGGDLVCFDYKSFNPGSTQDRVEKLWEAGWEPTEKTKTHYKFDTQAAVGKPWGKTVLTPELYQEKKDHFSYYGWTVSEENLLTLPESAPQAARDLAEWLTLEGRRSSLVEWLGQCKDDGRIHGKFWHIGAWTGRMAHSNPNSANIAAGFHGEPKNAVEVVKATYDSQLRGLWCADKDAWLVGSDAEGIQLRILAHYLRNDDYVQAIVAGRKEDETDIHNVNKRALGLSHIDRDDAKRFIYSHVLGAGLAKTSRILRCSQSVAKVAVSDFQQRLGLDVLRRGIISRDAQRGYFDGLDGRKVLCDSEHLMLAGYLQNGEAVVMKHANILWREWADKEKINYKQLNFVHDEWQTEVYDSLDAAERLGYLQRESIVEVGKRLNIYCPLAGSTDIGKTWNDTH